ncbi:hypothetical protein LIA77_00375 [Sarocladium implicatum]|nr:hypothetical protein LIA77_00375 [Sarocladium implicatum]
MGGARRWNWARRAKHDLGRGKEGDENESQGLLPIFIVLQDSQCFRLSGSLSANETPRRSFPGRTDIDRPLWLAFTLRMPLSIYEGVGTITPYSDRLHPDESHPGVSIPVSRARSVHVICGE